MPRPQAYPRAEEDILAFFYGYETDHGFPPTIQEAVEHWNETHDTKVTLGFVHNYVRKLAASGRLVDRLTLGRRWGAPTPERPQEGQTDQSEGSTVPKDRGGEGDAGSAGAA